MSLSNTGRSIMLDQPLARFVMAGAGRGKDVPLATPSAPPPPPPPDLDAIRREAFAAGEAQARKEMNDLRAEQRKRMARLEQELECYQDNLERALFERMIDLSVKTAEIILRCALPDADMARSVLREIIQRITDLERVQVRMHPDDAELLRADVESGELGPAGRLEIVADVSLRTGDVLVENGFGCFDARLTQRLNLLREELIKRWRKTDAE